MTCIQHIDVVSRLGHFNNFAPDCAYLPSRDIVELPTDDPLDAVFRELANPVDTMPMEIEYPLADNIINFQKHDEGSLTAPTNNIFQVADHQTSKETPIDSTDNVITMLLDPFTAFNHPTPSTSTLSYQPETSFPIHQLPSSTSNLDFFDVHFPVSSTSITPDMHLASFIQTSVVPTAISPPSLPHLAGFQTDENVYSIGELDLGYGLPITSIEQKLAKYFSECERKPSTPSHYHYFIGLLKRYCRIPAADVSSRLHSIHWNNVLAEHGDFGTVLEMYGGLGSPHNWVHSYAVFSIYNRLESGTKAEVKKLWQGKSTKFRQPSWDNWVKRMGITDKLINGTGRQDGMGHAVLAILDKQDEDKLRKIKSEEIPLLIDAWAELKSLGGSVALEIISREIRQIINRLVDRLTEPAPIKVDRKGKAILQNNNTPPSLVLKEYIFDTKKARTQSWPNKDRNDIDSESDSEDDSSPLSTEGLRFRELLTRKTDRRVTLTDRVREMIERCGKMFNAETERWIRFVMKEFKAAEGSDEESRWISLQLAYLASMRNDLGMLKMLDPRLYRFCRNVDDLTMGDWGACFDAVCIAEILDMKDYLETSNEIWKMKLDVEKDYAQVEHNRDYKRWREMFEEVVYSLY